MKNRIFAVLGIVVGIWITHAYAVELASATDVQLMEQFLLPGATAAQKQNAIIGVREMLQLPSTANAAMCVAALKKELRRQIRQGYMSVKEDSMQTTVKPKVDAAATADLWPESSN